MDLRNIMLLEESVTNYATVILVFFQTTQSVVLSSIKKLFSQSIIQDIVKYMRSVTQVLQRCQVKCFVVEKQVKLKIWQAMRGKLFKGEVQWKTIFLN